MKRATLLCLCLVLCSSTCFTESTVMKSCEELKTVAQLEQQMKEENITEESVIDSDLLVLKEDASKSRSFDKPKCSSYVDWQSLEKFIREQPFIEGRRQLGKLKFSGDVRTRWVYAKEKFKNKIPDPNEKLLPINRYRTDFNMLIDYRADQTWLTSKMQWVALAGANNVGSGVDIDRAFIGYRPVLFDRKDTDFFVEIGRSSLGDIFESEIEFNGTFDGIHLYYSQGLPGKKTGTFIMHGGPFVVDMTKKHYAWIAEAIVNELPGGFCLKGNLIDWHSFDHSETAPTPPPPAPKSKYEFLVGQILLSCERSVPFGKNTTKPLLLTGAALKNFLSRATPTTMHKKQDLAWYAGFTLGELKKAKDWRLSVYYEYVQALAIPEEDIAGIGHGNTLEFFFYEAIQEGYDPADANGFGNYKGVSLCGTYCVAPGLLLQGKASFSQPAVAKIGDTFNYSRCEIGLITAF
ncbi:MAG: hypothetical protein RSB82_00715 [Victivallaceae bacterium]